jgi:PAS domain S-box-containing protein
MFVVAAGWAWGAAATGNQARNQSAATHSAQVVTHGDEDAAGDLFVHIPLYHAMLLMVLTVFLVGSLLRSARLKQEGLTLHEELEQRREAAKSLAHFRALVESSQDAIAGIDLRGVITSWNAGAEWLYGYMADEAVGKHISILSGEDQHNDGPMLLERIKQGDTIENFETQRCRKNGQIVDVSLTLSPIRDADGVITGMSAIAHDIAERKRAEERLRAGEARFRAVFNHAPIGIALVNPQGKFLQSNPAFDKLMGLRPGECADFKLEDLTHFDDWEECALAVSRIFSGEIDNFQLRARYLRGGSIVWGNVYGSSMRDSDGSPKYLLIMVEDITSRRKAELALQESERRFTCFMSHLPGLAFMKDRFGRYLYVNDAVRRVPSSNQRDWVGKSDFDLWPREIALKIRENDRFVLSTGQPQNLIEDVPQGDEIRKWLVVKFPLIVEEGTHSIVAGVAIDVTSQKRVEEELARAKHAAEAANRAKSEFLANMSHEIRTPMTAILGFSEILSECPISAEARASIDIVQRNGEHLLTLVDDILDLSKIEAGRMEIDQEPSSPAEVAREVIETMRVRAEAKGLELSLEEQGPLPPAISTDPRRLRQILVNLVGNAVKFTEVGAVRIVARSETAASAQPLVAFEVVDTGIGMSGEQMAQLFRPFTQVDTSTSRRFGGTGLGLAISKRLAVALGGDLTVSSEPNHGSSFRLTIAATPVNRDQTPNTTHETSLPVTTTEQIPQSLSGRILLVEDGPDNQRLITFLLRKAGIEVVVAENGEVALQTVEQAQAQRTTFDVILMDMQMPVLDGYQATRQLRARGWKGPIVALTAHAMKEDRQTCLDAGCDDYLSKPIRRPELLAVIARHLARPSNAPAAASHADS